MSDLRLEWSDNLSSDPRERLAQLLRRFLGDADVSAILQIVHAQDWSPPGDDIREEIERYIWDGRACNRGTVTRLSSSGHRTSPGPPAGRNRGSYRSIGREHTHFAGRYAASQWLAGAFPPSRALPPLNYYKPFYDRL